MNLHLFFLSQIATVFLLLVKYLPMTTITTTYITNILEAKDGYSSPCSAVREPTSLPSSSRYDLLRAAQQCQ